MDGIMVSVFCDVYNHEKFIATTIEGFLKQKTNFRFEVLIHDDASTDKSVSIIKKYADRYPEIIIPYYEAENQFSKKNGNINIRKLQYGRARGKYIALCEGDDYWIDENKLQMQVDYLEKHDECTLCCHAGIIVDENGIMQKPFREFKSSCIVPIGQIIRKWICPTASIIYRKEIRLSSDFPKLMNAPCGDYPLLIDMALRGTVYYIDKSMCAYRKNSTSVSANWAKSKEKQHDVNSRFIEMLNDIDAYTNYNYHDDFTAMRSVRELMNLLIERKYFLAMSPKYRFARKSRAKECVYYVVSDRLPWLLNIYRCLRKSKKKQCTV